MMPEGGEEMRTTRTFAEQGRQRLASFRGRLMRRGRLAVTPAYARSPRAASLPGSLSDLSDGRLAAWAKSLRYGLREAQPRCVRIGDTFERG
jgi:hypothetical protein